MFEFYWYHNNIEKAKEYLNGAIEICETYFPKNSTRDMTCSVRKVIVEEHTDRNKSINNYYNIDKSNELLSDIEAIKELNIDSLAVINNDVKIYRSNSLKSGVCSKL